MGPGSRDDTVDSEHVAQPSPATIYSRDESGPSLWVPWEPWAMGQGPKAHGPPAGGDTLWERLAWG